MGDWQRQFETLRAEWHGLRGDLMSVIGRQRSEVDHSAALAWLLDPKAPHGLGPAFLRWFLLACDVEQRAEDLADATVACEEEATYRRKSCRADICIRVGALKIVVETKVDDTDRDRQCNKLVDAFCKSKKPGEYPLFVFLTPDGVPPSSYSPRKGIEFLTVSFRQIAQGLAALVRDSGFEGRTVAQQSVLNYLETLNHEFGHAPESIDSITHFYMDNQATIDEWERARKRHVAARNSPRTKVRLTKGQHSFLDRNEWLIRQWGKLSSRVCPVASSFYESIREPLLGRATSLTGQPELWPLTPRSSHFRYLVLHLPAWKLTRLPRVAIGLEWKRTSNFQNAIFGVVSFKDSEGRAEVRNALGQALSEAFPDEAGSPGWPVLRRVDSLSSDWRGREPLASSLVDEIAAVWEIAAPIVTEVLLSLDHKQPSA